MSYFGLPSPPLFLLQNDKKLCRQAAKHTADAGNFVILPYQIK